MKLYTEKQVKQLMHTYLTSVVLRPSSFGQAEEVLFNSMTPIELPSDEELAVLFHNKYEELAPKFGYETKVDTKEFNKDSSNGKLMIEVCNQILQILNQNK